MSATIHDDKTFNELIYKNKITRDTEFNNCKFKKCDFNDNEFALCKFIDCIFEDCNLSMIRFGRSTMNGVVFKGCKLLGINFSLCEDFLFTVRFEGCTLDYSSFMHKKMPKTHFVKSSLKEVTFTQAILTASVFEECNLNGAVFNGTNLTSVNFATAIDYAIDPEINTMNKAIFSSHGLEGLLYKYNIKVV